MMAKNAFTPIAGGNAPFTAPDAVHISLANKKKNTVTVVIIRENVGLPSNVQENVFRIQFSLETQYSFLVAASKVVIPEHERPGTIIIAITAFPIAPS
jgi:hypothetical protein